MVPQHASRVSDCLQAGRPDLCIMTIYRTNIALVHVYYSIIHNIGIIHNISIIHYLTYTRHTDCTSQDRAW